METAYLITTLLFAATYSEQYEAAMTNDSEIVVFGTASWCGPCQVLKRELPTNSLIVDIDQERALSTRLQITTVPALIHYQKEDGKWVRKHLVGLHAIRQWLSTRKLVASTGR